MRRIAVASAVALAVLAALAVGATALGTPPLGSPSAPVGLDSPGPESGTAGHAGVSTPPEESSADEEPQLVRVGDARLWPYVGPERSFDRPASSINVVVHDDPRRVRHYLTERRGWNRTDDEWAEEGADESGVVADERVPWRDAPGASRYAYAAGRGWMTERYQLHRGEYFGTRLHLRAYGPENGNWTAVQAHAEHWDWFTITHTVDSVEDAQSRVEEPFLADPGFEVRREYHANADTYDADGWTTVVALALAPLFGLRMRRRLRRLGDVATAQNRRRVALAGVLAALPLAVRFGGVFCERSLPWLSSDAVVAIWYPVLVGGVPLAAVGLGRRLPTGEAGALAAVGLGTGVLLDYAYLGASSLPIPVAVHRVTVVVAVGLLAAGAGRRAGDGPVTALRVGAMLWVVAAVAGHLV